MQPDNQFDFFMAPGAPQKKVPLGFGPNKPSKMKLIIFGAVGIMLLGLIITVGASFFSGGPSNSEQLASVAQKQNELIRISSIALKDAKGNEARNLAMTTKLSLMSDQQTLTSGLKAQKVKVNLKAGENKKTDDLLLDAKQNNRFDEAYLEYIREELVNYQKQLSDVYKSTQSRSLKETLKYQYQNASVLIGVEPEV